MDIIASPSKNFCCEVCGQSVANPTIVGIESERDSLSQVSLCYRCGPLDLELMELCREVTVGCTVN